MAKQYSEQELRDMGMDDVQISAILSTYESEKNSENKQVEEDKQPVNVTQFHVHEHNVRTGELKITSLEQIASYKDGMVVELPPFGDGQPFVARLCRPSMLKLIKSGKIPNSLLNQATSLFANGASALTSNGKNAATADDLFDVIDVVVDAALLEPTYDEIKSVGMELSDDQMMAIFSYTQRGVKALEQFRTE